MRSAQQQGLGIGQKLMEIPARAFHPRIYRHDGTWLTGQQPRGGRFPPESYRNRRDHSRSRPSTACDASLQQGERIGGAGDFPSFPATALRHARPNGIHEICRFVDLHPRQLYVPSLYDAAV